MASNINSPAFQSSNINSPGLPCPFFDSPGPNLDTTSVVISNLGLDAVMVCSLVSRAWNTVMQHGVIWSVLFDIEKVPRVSEMDGNSTSLKEDFQYMYLRTASTRKKMAPLGCFVGIIPNIDFAKHTVFKTSYDAYDPTQKMDKTWEYVCTPLYIHRKYENGDEKLVGLLKTKGDFELQKTEEDFMLLGPQGGFETEVETDETKELKKTGLLIPFTFRNLIVVANYVGEKRGIRVFGFVDPEVLNQCSGVPNRVVKVTQMRKEIPESTRNKTPTEQQAGLAQKGHKVVDLQTRALYNVLNILNKGTCPDSSKEDQEIYYSNTSTEITIGNDNFPVVIEGFGSYAYADIDVSHDEGQADEVIGAVPVVPAEVQSLILESVKDDENS